MVKIKLKKYKKIAIIIALKRLHTNSVIKKNYAHVVAPKLGISTYLYSSLFKELIKEGIITDFGNYYRIKKFHDIVIDFNSDTGLFFGNFEVLKSKEVNYKTILNELYSQLIISNVIERQKYIIELKKSSNNKNRTVLKAREKLKKLGYSVDEKNLNNKIITSARSISKLLEVSIGKANEILNNSSLFKRKIDFFWIKGISKAKIMQLRVNNPFATIIPFVNYDCIKVCNGSILLDSAFSMYKNQKT